MPYSGCSPIQFHSQNALSVPAFNSVSSENCATREGANPGRVKTISRSPSARSLEQQPDPELHIRAEATRFNLGIHKLVGMRCNAGIQFCPVSGLSSCA